MSHNLISLVRDMTSALNTCDALRHDERLAFEERLGLSRAAGFLEHYLEKYRYELAEQCAPWFESPEAERQARLARQIEATFSAKATP